MGVVSYPVYESKRDDYILVDNVDKFVDSVLKNPPKEIAVDTETYYNPELTAPQAITKWIRGKANNCPFGVSMYWGDTGYWINKDLHKLKPILEHPDIVKILHNSKYDNQMLRNIGIALEGTIMDTMLMIHLIDEEFECKTPNGKKIRSKRLKDLAYHFLNDDAHEYEDLVAECRRIIAKNMGRKVSDVGFDEVGTAMPELMKDYAVSDTEFTYKLYFIFEKLLKEQELEQAYDVDINATEDVIAIERMGFKIDIVKLKEYQRALEEIIDRRKSIIFSLTAYQFNIDADRELVAAFGKLGVQWSWYTDKGSYQTDKNVLRELIATGSSEVAEVAQSVMEYRKAAKFLSTYIVGIEAYIQGDGKVHPDFWINPNDFGEGGTVTGRMSGANPNLQNIPKKPVTLDGIEFNIRSLFVPDEDYILVFMDGKQQEYRMLGHYGRDEAFMAFIHDNKDIHKATASMMFDVPYEDVTDEQRDTGKTTNFAVVYGLSNPALAKSLGHKIDESVIRDGTRYLYNKYKVYELPPYQGTVTYEKVMSELPASGLNEQTLAGIEYYFSEEVLEALKHASTVRTNYFKRFPGIKQFLDDAKSAAQRRGYIKTWTGRRRHFKNPKREAYKAPNACIQGGCGDILKSALPRIRKLLQENGAKSSVVNLVHDEVIFMINTRELYLIPFINAILADLPFRVPMDWDIEWGLDWGNKREFDSVAKLESELDINLVADIDYDGIEQALANIENQRRG